MEHVMEALTILCLCAAVGVMLYRFVKNKSVYRKMDRFTLITIGTGFVIGAVRSALADFTAWTFVLYVAGAWLCYGAILFSFPGKGDQTNE